MTIEELTQDMQLLNSIIAQICNYAVDNDMQPIDTVKAVAQNLLALCELASHEIWNKEN